MTNKKPQRVAIVHDWLIGGGAEKVVEALHQMYPEAPIYTSFTTDEWKKRLDGKVVTGYLQHWPFSKLRKFIPILRILWFQSLDLSGYDLILSSSGSEAKGLKTNSETMHINYCPAPTHYYWNRYDQYLANPGLGIFNSLARAGLKFLIRPLRRWDHKAAQRPNLLIANSTFTKNQIQKYYQRSSKVIFPPVDIDRFKSKVSTKREGFVVAGRQTPYKRFDLAIMACTKLRLPLLVIGDGPDHKRLKQLGGPSVTFQKKATDKEVVTAFQSAKAFIFPGTDDFGIVAVEALAAGCPVIAHKDGGALDYIIPGKTGVFFNQPTVKSLTSVLKNFSAKDYQQTFMKNFVNNFNPDTFKSKIRKLVKESLARD